MPTSQLLKKWIFTWMLPLLLTSVLQAAELADLFRLQDATTKRVSSADPDWRNGNRDARPIQPGQTLTVADIAGPGVIRHIWFTISAKDPQYGRSLVLRIYWDGSDVPAIESPFGDFFAVGHGERRPVNSLPVAVSSEGRAYNCYWPMPFRKHAKITLTNDSPTYKVSSAYFYIDYEEVPSLPSDTAYFNAQYRQEYPAKPGDYLICDTEGRGQYVGTVLSVKCRTPGWFGEGDDRFYIDGDTEPTLRGTGTEDYFCDAWGFREFNRPYYGVVIFGGYEVGSLVSVYRWHVADPIHFKKSLRLEIEHKGEMADTNGKGTSSFTERPDLFSSVAFWYQTGQAKRFASLPPVRERTVPVTTIEFETRQAATRVVPGDIEIGSQYDSIYSDSRSLSAPIERSGQTMIVPFELADDRTGFVRLRLAKYLDYGSFEVSLDGRVLKGLERVDLYNKTLDVQTFELGEMSLAKGKHELRFKAIGKSAMSAGYHIGIDSLQIEHFTAYFEPAE